MADGIVQLAADSTGKKIDTSELTVGANTVERQRVIIADDSTAAGLAKVTNAAPSTTDYGLVVRLVPGFNSTNPLFARISDGTNQIKVLADNSLKVAFDARVGVGVYYASSGNLTVLATAQTSLVGFFWLINPVGSAVIVYLRNLDFTSAPTAATAFISSPRITVERVTFTGTASGATITPAKRDSTDAAATATVRTASTGLTLTAGAVITTWLVAPILTAVGAAVPVPQTFQPRSTVGDLVLRAGEGIVCRQPDNGTTSDTRKIQVDMKWEEV